MEVWGLLMDKKAGMILNLLKEIVDERKKR